MRRRLGLWLVRADLSARIAAAQRLSAEAYKGRPGERRGRAWWNGYQRALEALRDGTQL